MRVAPLGSSYSVGGGTPTLRYAQKFKFVQVRRNRMNRLLPMAKIFALALAMVCLFALPSVNLFVQALGGNLFGTVIDSPGALVTNSDGEATNVETNVAHSPMTNE